MKIEGACHPVISVCPFKIMRKTYSSSQLPNPRLSNGASLSYVKRSVIPLWLATVVIVNSTPDFIIFLIYKSCMQVTKNTYYIERSATREDFTTLSDYKLRTYITQSRGKRSTSSLQLVRKIHILFSSSEKKILPGKLLSAYPIK